MFVLAKKACNVTTTNNGNTESAKPAHRSKSTALLSRQANLLTGAVPPCSDNPLESTRLEDDLNSSVFDPPEFDYFVITGSNYVGRTRYIWRGGGGYR